MDVVTTADELGARASLAGRAFDRRVLISNLAAGGLFLLFLVATGAWPFAVIGAAYVGVASLFLAGVHARDTLSRRQEALAWVAPWIVAVLLWTWLASGVEPGSSGSLLNLWFGLVIATPCYLVWQLAAVAVRQLLARSADVSDIVR